MSELVLALPQLSGDRAVEVSRESVVTEGSLASGLEKQKGWMTGRAGLETGALEHQCGGISGRFVFLGDWVVGACQGLSHLSVLAQKQDAVSQHVSASPPVSCHPHPKLYGSNTWVPHSCSAISWSGAHIQFPKACQPKRGAPGSPWRRSQGRRCRGRRVPYNLSQTACTPSPGQHQSPVLRGETLGNPDNR